MTGLSTTQVALRLGCSVKSLQTACQAGRVPAHMDGTQWRIRISDLPAVRAALRCVSGPAVAPEGLDWQDYALCAETDPEAFFPEKGGSTREAKAVCMACEVRVECLGYALANDERFGIWGGLSERERRALKKVRASQPDAPDVSPAVGEEEAA